MRSRSWTGRKVGALLGAVVLGTFVLATQAGAQQGLEEQNARLEAENEKLRAELDALRREAGEAAGESRDAAREAQAGAPAAAASAEPEDDPTSTVVSEYVPRTRITLSVGRDEAGRIEVLGTPWYRTVPDTGLLPLREFIQFRAVPAREGRPEQVWMSLNRQGMPSSVGAGTIGTLQVGSWSGKAAIVDQKTSRRRRVGRQATMPLRKDETTTFALPGDALAKLAVADRATFDAGPVHFEFTDEHVAAAAALQARLSKEEQTP